MSIKRVNVLTMTPGSVPPTPGPDAANIVYDIATNTLSAVLQGGTTRQISTSSATSSGTTSGTSFADLTGPYSANTSLNNKIVAIDASVNSAYSTLTSGSTVAIDFQSKRNPAFLLTAALTAMTFTVSNDLFSAEAYIQFLKTTASDSTITFPSGTLITDQNGTAIVGTAVTLTSTSSGDFDIVIKKRLTGYRAIIKQVVA